MSLINKMLNDLDKRHATAKGEQPLFGDVRHSPSRRLGSPILILVLVVAAAGLGALAWSQFNKTRSQAPAEHLAASETIPKPAEPPVVIQQVAQPEVASTRRDDEVNRAAAKSAAIEKARKKESGKKESSQVAMSPHEDKPKSHIEKESSFKVISPQQQSNNLYLQAISQMQQSRDAEALDSLAKSIRANPANHNARQLSAILLADAGRNKEAQALLQDGLEISPGHSDFSIKLARLQFADGAKDKAFATLERGLPKAGNDAEYHAFFAALLQNQGRHDEAVQHYITSLRNNPSNPNWLIGVGISLKAIGKKNDAAEAFQRALNTGELGAKVAQFAEEQLKTIRQ